MKKWYINKTIWSTSINSDRWIFLIDNKMLTFIDCRLRVIKQVHNQFMGGLDTIMIGDLYQAPLVWDSWIFKSKTKPLARKCKMLQIKTSNETKWYKFF
jgi:hypothetical protein